MGCGTLAALALVGAGTGAQMYGAGQSRKAMNQAVADQIAAQQGFAKQGQGMFQESMAKSTPEAVGQQWQQGTQAIKDATGKTNLMGLGQPPSVTQTGQDVKSRSQQEAAAQFGGLGNVGVQQYLKDIDTNSKLGLLSGYARQSAGTLPISLEGAQQRYANLGAMGSLLGTAGGVVGAASAARAPTPPPPGVFSYGLPYNPWAITLPAQAGLPVPGVITT